jgi:hypothetical protein
VTLFILPTIERAFDVTTGMTLIELRDPKHPLLRELQQRAPGTYNHSLNVAAIAEAAADAIGANAIADVCRGAVPRHREDEQARLFRGEPDAAGEQARQADARDVAAGDRGACEGRDGAGAGVQPAADDPALHRERTTEQRSSSTSSTAPRSRRWSRARLADAVESTARSLAEPTPARIETVVRTLANRRLMDGQFDECDITLKDLAKMTESIAKSVTAFYHGRVMYKSTADLAKQRA